MWVPEVQMMFIIQRTNLDEKIINKLMSEIKHYLVEKLNIFPEFAFISLSCFAEKIIHFKNFSNEISIIDCINTLKTTKEQNSEPIPLDEGMKLALNLNWTKNKHAKKNLIILAPFSIDFDKNLKPLFEEFAKRDVQIYTLKNVNEILNKYREEDIFFEEEKKENGVHISANSIISLDSFNMSEILIKSLDPLLTNKVKRACQIKQKIIWYDPKIEEPANVEIFQDLSPYCQNYTIEKFNNYKIAHEFIAKSSEKLIVITPGTDGKVFTNLIHNYDAVLAILVFCCDVKKHQLWAKNFPKIHGVYSKISKIYNSLVRLHNFYCAIFKICFVEIEESVAKEFWRVILEYLKVLKNNGQSNNKEILKELISLNPPSEKEIKSTFVKKEFEILKAIIYLYSTNFIYNQFNQRLIERLYRKLLNTMTTTVQELLFNDRYSAQRYGNGGVLYRGVKGIASEILDEYNKYLSNDIQPLFFPAFTSASSNFEEAKKFSNGIIFEIHLSKTNPHPHIRLINKEWSQYPGEEETLIYPYFPFHLEKIEPIDKKYWVITIIQDEESKVFSKNPEETKTFLAQVIKKELASELKEGSILKDNFIDDIIKKIEKNGDIDFLDVIEESIFKLFYVFNNKFFIF